MQHLKILELSKNRAECIDLLQGFDKIKVFIEHKINRTAKDLQHLKQTNIDILRVKGYKLTIEKSMQICYN